MLHVQESKLARELREEAEETRLHGRALYREGLYVEGQTHVLCEAQAHSRAALAAEQQALLQEQRAPVQAITRFAGRDGTLKQQCTPSCEHVSRMQVSEARQRAAEHQPRAEEAELQDHSKRIASFVHMESRTGCKRVGRFVTGTW